MNEYSSSHSDKERCTVALWVVNEVRKAVDMGYGLVEMFKFGITLSRVLSNVPIQVLLQSTLTCS